MANSRVLRPGHVCLRVLDMDEAIIHYRDRLGLLDAGQDDSGRQYFKAWDEHDAYSVILREANSPGMDFMAFKVFSDEDLYRYEKRLNDAGVETQRVPENELKDCGERVQFSAPSGHVFELFSHKKYVGNGLGNLNPESFRDDLVGMAPHSFDHCALYGVQPKETADLFVNVLDFDVTETIEGEEEGVLAAFLTCSNKAHDVAFIISEEKGKLHHASFMQSTWEEILRSADIISKYDIPLDIGPTRHGITRGRTVYFFDPSGNRNEVFAGDYRWYPDRPPIKWSADKFGKAIFYHTRELNERFLNVVT